MSNIAIHVEGLGKRYRIGPRERYRALRDTLTAAIHAPLRMAVSAWNGRRYASGRDLSNSYIWAIKDLSLEVKSGEVVGIIGPNGAGKTTLLKILSRITEPTEGWVEIHGRVGSLLEVGAGFHPELTGRENIYLNGTILGMKKAEVKRKFDEIVEFAEVEKFIDTPVKHYSSGMYVRLAFAVAAHLEPEIMFVDEVLAVGDAAFQKKCLGKMGDVAREGRTVLLVSHNMNAVTLLCSRAILLAEGRLERDGGVSEIVTEYLTKSHGGGGERVWNDPLAAPGNDRVRLHAVRIISDGDVTGDVDIQKEVKVEVEFWNYKPGVRLCTSIHLLDRMAATVLCTANFPSASLQPDDWFGRPYPAGLFRATCTLPGNFLNEGRYGINALVLSDVTNLEADAREVVWFTVHDTGAMRQEYAGGYGGVVRPRLAWETECRRPLDEEAN